MRQKLNATVSDLMSIMGKKTVITTVTLPRRLQFSDVSTFTSLKLDTKLTLCEGSSRFSPNREVEKGIILIYSPLNQREGKTVVQLTSDDIKATYEYWSTTFIGYVLGDTLYEKYMNNFVTVMWNFMTKPQILYHADGLYMLFCDDNG